jgi:hypothetical protein
MRCMPRIHLLEIAIFNRINRIIDSKSGMTLRVLPSLTHTLRVSRKNKLFLREPLVDARKFKRICPFK